MIFLFTVGCLVAAGLAGRARGGLERLARRRSRPLLRARPGGVGMRPGRAGGASLDLEATAGLADRLAALLGAGLPVLDCWSTLGRGVGERGGSVRPGDPAAAVAAVANSVAGVVGAGGPVGDGLRLAVGAPPSRFGRRSHDGVLWLAALWDLMDGCGAAPARVLRAVAEALRAERELRAAADVAAAGPRATVLILTAMPLAAIGLGCGLGADPLAVLLFTAAGRACLVLGCACWFLGIGWAYRLIRVGGR